MRNRQIHSVRQRLPDDPRRVEHRTVEAGSDEVRSSVVSLRQHDAAVAAAQTAAHGLFERDVAAAARGLRPAARPRASSGRAAHVELTRLPPACERRQRVAERRGDEAARRPGCHPRLPAPTRTPSRSNAPRNTAPGAARAVEQRRRACPRASAPRPGSRTAPARRRRRPSTLPPVDRLVRTVAPAGRDSDARARVRPRTAARCRRRFAC